MNWKNYWNTNVEEKGSDVFGQVQRKDLKSTLLTVNHIARVLDIKPSDTVLDVCCGNGIITQQIAKKCDSIVGVDQSEKLLYVAKGDYKEMNCLYINCSALEMSQFVKPHSFDKIYLQFSLQYFDKRNEGQNVIAEMLKCLKPNGKLFIGDITEHKSKHKLYDTPLKKAYYYKQIIQGKNRMGKFWKASELDTICKALNIKGTYLEQTEELPYAHYRFDYLIEN
ncbi:MAG: methyltransferase domain-containing protein [Flavobacteriaceae bacterium]